MPDMAAVFDGLRALFIYSAPRESSDFAPILRDEAGVPAYGIERAGWDAGWRYGFDNPECH